MNLLPFVFWSVWAVKVILKISAILLKASCFWGCQSISIVFIVLGGYVILPLNWATHKGKRQIGSDSELRWVFLCGSCSPWHFSTVLDGLKIHQACFIFQSKQELTQKYRFFTLLWPTLTTTHCFDTIQTKDTFWVLSFDPHPPHLSPLLPVMRSENTDKWFVLWEHNTYSFLKHVSFRILPWNWEYKLS
mgnify:CR=1 FL=1